MRNGEYQIVQGLAIDDFSRERMDATEEELREERDGVKDAARLTLRGRHGGRIVDGGPPAWKRGFFMLGAIVWLVLIAAAAFAVTQVVGAITLVFVAAVLFLAYRRLSLLTFTVTFTVLLAAYIWFGASGVPAGLWKGFLGAAAGGCCGCSTSARCARR